MPPVVAYPPQRTFEQVMADPRRPTDDYLRGPPPSMPYVPPLEEPQRYNQPTGGGPSGPHFGNFTGSHAPYPPNTSNPTPNHPYRPTNDLPRPPPPLTSNHFTSNIPASNRYQKGSYAPNGLYAPELGGFHPNMDSGRYPTVAGTGPGADIYPPGMPGKSTGVADVGVADIGLGLGAVGEGGGGGGIGGFRPDVNPAGLPPSQYTKRDRDRDRVGRRTKGSHGSPDATLGLGGIGGGTGTGSGAGYWDANPSTPGMNGGPELGQRSPKPSMGQRFKGRATKAAGLLTGNKAMFERGEAKMSGSRPRQP